MTPRHRARETAFQILYRYDLDLQNAGTPAPQAGILDQELERHFDHFRTPDESREFAASLVRDTLKRLDEIDTEIQKHAKNWRLSRMSVADRNLLRVGVSELQTHREIPVAVTLDEAVELAKQFGSEETPSFVNGILDAIAKECRPE